MQSTRQAGATLLLVFYTVVEWCVIAGGFCCVFRAFPATAKLGLADVVILLGFVAFGSAVQIPGVGGGMQIATVLVLTEFFGVSIRCGQWDRFGPVDDLFRDRLCRSGWRWPSMRASNGVILGIWSRKAPARRKQQRDLSVLRPSAGPRHRFAGKQRRRRHPPPPRVPQMRTPVHHLRAQRRNPLYGGQTGRPAGEIRPSEGARGAAEGVRKKAGPHGETGRGGGRSRIETGRQPGPGDVHHGDRRVADGASESPGQDCLCPVCVGLSRFSGCRGVSE